MNKYLFPIIALALWNCSSQIQMNKAVGARFLNERWIDINDIENITLGMNYNDVLDSLGEPLYTEIIKDTTLITYNYATKLYAVPIGWERYKMKKPTKKNRESGAPYGDLYAMNFKFKGYKLFEMKLISEKEFQLATDLTASKTKRSNNTEKFKWWLPLIPLSFWFIMTS